MKLVKKWVSCLTLAGILLAATAPVLASEQSQKQAASQVNINTADARQLETLPRIGPKVAQRIIEFRKANGGFKRIQDILKVKGIGEKTFERLKSLITV